MIGHYTVKLQGADPDVYEVVHVSLVKKGWRYKRVIGNLSQKKAWAIKDVLSTKDSDL